MSALLQIEVDQLRLQCAGFIEQHQKDLLPFLLDSETGETFSDGKECSISHFVEYCFTETLAKYLSDLKNTAMWGGHLEVSHTPFCKVPSGGHVISF